MPPAALIKRGLTWSVLFLFFHHLFQILLDAAERLLAEVVFHLAGVRRSHLRVDAQPDKKLNNRV